MSQRALVDALSSWDVRAVSVEPLLARDPWAGAARAFRVRTAAGDVWKLHVASSERDAERAVALAVVLDDRRVPAPVARCGRITLSRWIDGVLAADLPASQPLVTQAADLLAAVHSFGGGHGRESLPQQRRTAPLVERCARELAHLVRDGVVDEAVARVARAQLDRIPARSAWGLVHLDVSPDNLVVTPEGALVSIDHEHLSRSFHGYDLGRRWCRWPLDEDAEQWFAAAYSAAGRASLDEAERDGWRTLTAVRGIGIRRRRRAPWARALERLQATVALATARA